MSEPRRRPGITLVHWFLLVAVAQLSIDRIARPLLKPGPRIEPSAWYVGLEYGGLFLQYFATTLGVAALIELALGQARRRAGRAPLLRWPLVAAAAGTALLAVVVLVSTPSRHTSFVLETCYAAVIIGVLVTIARTSGDLGARIGTVIVAVPLLIHYAGAFAVELVLGEDAIIDGTVVERLQWWGRCTLIGAAMLSPYCFAPRPLFRAIIQIPPFAVAMLVAGLGAAMVRQDFPTALEVARSGLGIDLSGGVPSNELAIYLLALATLAWTLTACALAPAEARRRIGMGLGMVVLGGYGFAWPLAFVLGAVGLVVLAEAAAEVRDQEGATDVAPRTPPIEDQAWQGYVTGLVSALRKAGGSVNAVTVRGDGGLTSTVVVTERRGVPVRLRIERLGGCVIAIDTVCGRAPAGDTAATFTLHARPERLLGGELHPPPPAAVSGAARTGDTSFDDRFRLRGSMGLCGQLLDDGLRARAAASLDGWVAYWHGRGLEHRVHPGFGAPLDHPVPISELAMRGGAPGPDRLVAMVELLAEIAARGEVARDDAPATLAEVEDAEAVPGGEPDPGAAQGSGAL